MSTTKRYTILAAVLVIIAVSITYLQSGKAKHTGVSDLVAASSSAAIQSAINATTTKHTADFTSKKAQYPAAKELVSPDGYINTDNVPITIASLIGKKVILLDFWTYSCINCQRTLPYLTAWYGKYKDQGLEIIGVHTPEFDFEKVKANVEAATAKYGITYPVVQDNEYQTWDEYKNMYWPEHYLIDINGLVVDRHIGEGGYADTEELIQQLLEERKQVLQEPGSISKGLVNVAATAIEAGSPETYFGSSRNEYLGNGTQGKAGSQTLSLPKEGDISLNQLYLDGTWNFQGEYAENTSKTAKIVYKYDAKNVYFVASSKEGQKTGTSITVLRDGVPVSAERGADVDASGKATIKESRLYNLVNESKAGTHTLEIDVNGAGLDAFTFTFG